MNFQLVSAIIRGKWAIDSLYAMNAAGWVADVLNGTVEVESNLLHASSLKAVRSSRGGNGHSGTIGVISLTGPLMKYDQECGPAGMATIEKWVKSFDRNNEIDAIVLRIDSPGGTVDGTESLANAVKNTKKPVVAYVDGLMASAALWIGSSANHVMASSEMDEIGSIGVVLEFADMQPAYEKQGVKFHSVVASQSPDKRKMWEDLRAGNYDEYRDLFLNPIAEKFQAVVKANRPQVSDDFMTGKVYMAKNVMGVFVDSIGTFDDAIAKALMLADEQKIGAASAVASETNTTMQYEKLMELLGADSMEFEADGRRTFTKDEMQQVEDALVSQAPDMSAFEKEVEDLNATIAQKDNEIAELTAQVEALKNAPGAPITDTTEATDDAPVAADDDHMLSARDMEIFNMIKK